MSDSSRVLTFTKDLFQVWNSAEMVGDTTIQEFIETLPKSDRQILGQHYFIDNAAGELAPVWDFRDIQKFKGNQQAVFVGKVLESAPNADPGSVPLSHLGKVSGDILDEVFGILTIGGVPPSSVSPQCIVFDPVDIDAHALLCYPVSVLTGTRRISPSNTLLNIGSMVVPWDSVPDDFRCPIWGFLLYIKARPSKSGEKHRWPKELSTGHLFTNTWPHHRFTYSLLSKHVGNVLSFRC